MNMLAASSIFLYFCNFAKGIVPYRSPIWDEAGGICQAIPILLTGFIGLSIFRSYLKNRDHLINFEALSVILISMFEAWLVLHTSLFDVHFSKLFTVNPGDMFVLYVCLLVFEIAYNVPIMSFFKTFGQLFVIGFIGASINIVVTGFVMTNLLTIKDYAPFESLFFGTLCYPIYPVELVKKLKRMGQRARTVRILLEGETLIGLFTTFMWSIIVHEMWSAIGLEAKQWHYYFLMVFLKLLDLLVGYILGLLASYMIRNVCISHIDMAAVTFAVAFLSQVLNECVNPILQSISCIGVIAAGITLNIERTSQTKEIQYFLAKMWEFVALIMNYSFLVGYGVVIVYRIYPTATMADYALTLVTYVVSTVTRLLFFVTFMPVLSRLGYGLTWQQMIICCWGGMKNPFALVMLYRLDPKNDRNFHIFLLHGVFLYIWNLLINGMSIYFVMKLLGYYETSEKTILNMKRSMRVIQTARENTIEVLKMDKFLADANWDFIQKGTTLAQVYKEDVSDEEQDFLGDKVTTCPDCQKDVVYEPTPKEFKEMTREAKMRILKAKKMAYLRRYEKGLIPVKAYLILLQTVDIAMDSEDATIKLDLIAKLFKKDEWCYSFVVQKLYKLFVPHQENIKLPRKKWRQFCYNIVMSSWFEISIYVITIFQVCTIIYRLAMQRIVSKEEYIFYASMSLLYFLIYMSEFLMKLFAYSWIYVYKHGVKQYFKSHWNVLEFVLLWINGFDLIFYIVDLARNSRNFGSSITAIIFKSLRMFRLLRLLKLLGPSYIKFANFMEQKNNKKKLLAYDTACGHLYVEREIIENLDSMFDNKDIKRIIVNQMEMDRLVFVDVLGSLAARKPWIQVTSKTIQSSRVVRNHMYDAMLTLKKNGWVDLLEFSKLKESLYLNDKLIRKIQNVSPCAPLAYFSEIAWLVGDKKTMQFLYDNSVVKKFNAGEIIFDIGDVAKGIYFVISGMVQMNYEPNPKTLQKLKQDGCLPIIDYKRYALYEEAFSDQIIPGNLIGEHAFLTHRGYNSKVGILCPATTYFMKEEFLNEALKRNNDPVTGLQCRMWKTVSIRIATFILMDQPGYQSMNRDELHFQLERSFVPDLSNYKIFILNSLIKDIILIEGLVVDFNTRDIYTAPCYVPRTVQRLFLSRRSLNDLEIASRLLIIPIEGADEYDIMLTAEETCELISYSSSKCLRHLDIARKKKMKKELRFRSTEENPASKSRMAFSKSSTSEDKRSSYVIKNEKSSVIRTLKDPKSDAAEEIYHSFIASDMNIFTKKKDDKDNENKK